MSHDRRTVIAALGLGLPLGLTRASTPTAPPPARPPELVLRPFEDAVREAFAAPGCETFGGFPCRRVEVGHSDLLQAGVQGCHNDRPFAGFAAGHLRIVRVGFEPGHAVGGVRLYVCTVDVALTGGRDSGGESRPLDFESLPPAPVLVVGQGLGQSREHK